jgi:hypothetical protein
MDSYPTTETWTGTPGAIAPADGNASRGVAPASVPARGADDSDARLLDDAPRQQDDGATPPLDLGPNNERLEDLKPKMVHALRELVRQYREEGITARRHEIRRIRQARLFWQVLQYAWWNPNDMNWHLPFEQRFSDDRALEEMPRYQFVTNFYQGFGLSFIAVLSQDVPSVRFYPQSAQSLEDISAARAASDVAALIEQNNHIEHLLTSIGYFLWTDGKLGAYVRYVADGQRFGFHEENVLEALEIPLGEDVYVCPQCAKETPLSSLSSRPERPEEGRAVEGSGQEEMPDADSSVGAQHAAPLLGTISCAQCGAELSDANLRRAERVTVPRIAGTRRVPTGPEVISIAGGLELNTPVCANEMHEYPYLQWQAEVHRAKLKAAYPHAADKIETSPSQGSEDVYARVSRLSVEQGLPSIHPGDALMNLITFDRTWLRPWAFYSVEDAEVRAKLLALFPDGCYVAFAGDAYCEARSESTDDHWRVLHALPGDGQNRPSVGDSLVQVQERYNVQPPCDGRQARIAALRLPARRSRARHRYSAAHDCSRHRRAARFRPAPARSRHRAHLRNDSARTRRHRRRPNRESQRNGAGLRRAQVRREDAGFFAAAEVISQTLIMFRFQWSARPHRNASILLALVHERPQCRAGKMRALPGLDDSSLTRDA